MDILLLSSEFGLMSSPQVLLHHVKMTRLEPTVRLTAHCIMITANLTVRKPLLANAIVRMIARIIECPRQ